MKRTILFTVLLMALTACTTFKHQTSTEPAATDLPQVSIPNPASVYCIEQGNQHEIQTAADGSQSGICTFPDGSTCDEWAYFRGECGPTAQESTASPLTIEATPEGSGGGPGGGTNSGGNASGGYKPEGTSEELADWWGIIKSTPSGAQYDDYFERQDLAGQVITFGITSLDPQVQAQIEALRDSGKVAHLYGTLFSNVPDYNLSQIQVDRIEIDD